MGAVARRGARAPRPARARRARRTCARRSATNPGAALARAAGHAALRPRRPVVAVARPRRARSAGRGRRGDVPRHQRSSRAELGAVAAGAQSDRPAPRQPRRRRLHRPCAGRVRRAGVAAQGDGAGQLQLPLGARARRGAARRPRMRDDQDRPEHGRRLRSGLPRDHALRRRRRPGDPLRPAALTTHRSRAVVLRPRRRDAQPRLRQRHLHEGRPSRPGDRVRPPLAGRDRQGPNCSCSIRRSRPVPASPNYTPPT
jgi:hypothetical protein